MLIVCNMYPWLATTPLSLELHAALELVIFQSFEFKTAPELFDIMHTAVHSIDRIPEHPGLSSRITTWRGSIFSLIASTSGKTGAT